MSAVFVVGRHADRPAHSRASEIRLKWTSPATLIDEKTTHAADDCSGKTMSLNRRKRPRMFSIEPLVTRPNNEQRPVKRRLCRRQWLSSTNRCPKACYDRRTEHLVGRAMLWTLLLNVLTTRKLFTVGPSITTRPPAKCATRFRVCSSLNFHLQWVSTSEEKRCPALLPAKRPLWFARQSDFNYDRVVNKWPDKLPGVGREWIEGFVLELGELVNRLKQPTKNSGQQFVCNEPPHTHTHTHTHQQGSGRHV